MKKPATAKSSNGQAPNEKPPIKQAVIIGASGALGSAMADNLSARGAKVIRLARSLSGDQHIDLASDDSIAAAAARLKLARVQPDLVMIASGLLHNDRQGPEKALRDLEGDWLVENFRINAIAPALCARHFLPLMPRKRRAIFAVLSARVGSISDNHLGGWYGYRASKAALNMMIRTIAIEWARSNDQAIATALHPGTVDSDLSAPFQGNVPPGKLFDAAQSAGYLLEVIDGLSPAQSGRIFAWDGAEIQP